VPGTFFGFVAFGTTLSFDAIFGRAKKNKDTTGIFTSFPFCEAGGAINSLALWNDDERLLGGDHLRN